ncbi:acyl-CoA dehydrogenase family protein [Mycobacterium haemophilum]|uniref:Acyl-CoA dehydrogenase n=1 Tax=Mycobacterium haemophilum TaxID=29311 RepID=A0A0I9V3V6_9MYCO|nr:acyl-CoA dehydrogenase family protein [Mycobacterium haemophilum]AKN16663.1 acyl-CoA dehydrogenase [Mycobacterium haemophilum DSM 44634]KLO30264.1 acyl-CoA dehydrogenase [Mycobacterium haemophilum]KLO37394.1 acyl-CoA dehydrogenase [Mycobacterium haemophilum]KLO43943.1 acyl-CoA dehydrogenase [Mycobacterium haemophilum]KLO49638.1 acyl-CoA dehydrogenase [Mycobacterium haemophilum]
MDFQLNDEQLLLRDTTRDLLSRSYDPESRNKVIDTDLGWSRDVWSQLADVGILGLGFDPCEAGQIEIMVVLTEIGRRLAPEPVVHAALAPGALIAELGSDTQRQLLDKVAAGQKLLAFAHLETGHRRPTAAVTTHAVQQGDSWTLSGTKNPVLAGDCADTLVVSAALPDGGTGLFLVSGSAVNRHSYPTFDGQRGAQIQLDSTPAEPLGDTAQVQDFSRAIRNAIIRIQSALCAEAIGAMEETLRLTTDYLKTRKQFGVTLNKFQSLTQRAADMYISLELARSMNLYAAMSIADGTLDPVIASRAKLQIGRSGRHIAQEAIQLHGGIGMTAEYPVGHYAARLTAIEHTLGSSQDHLHVLVDHIAQYDLARL